MGRRVVRRPPVTDGRGPGERRVRRGAGDGEVVLPVLHVDSSVKHACGFLARPLNQNLPKQLVIPGQDTGKQLISLHN